MPTVWAKITDNAKLLTLPDVYFRLRSVMDDPDYCMGEIAEVIGHDPATTARLLRLVNSAHFGLAAKIDSLSRAVGILGAQQVHDLVLATSVAETFDGLENEVMDMHSFWRESVFCALTCKELAVRCNTLDSERLFVAGLLRDIGHLIMFQTVPNQIRQAMQYCRKQGVPLFKVERVLLGVDYAQVGSALMRQWNLPRSLWEPTEYHVEPEKAEEFQMMSSLVHIAAVITDAVRCNHNVELHLENLVPDVWQTTGLTTKKCLDIPERSEEQLTEVVQLIFPRLKQAVG